MPRRINPALEKHEKDVAEKAGLIAARHLASQGIFELTKGEKCSICIYIKQNVEYKYKNRVSGKLGQITGVKSSKFLSNIFQLFSIVYRYPVNATVVSQGKKDDNNNSDKVKSAVVATPPTRPNAPDKIIFKNETADK